MAGHWAPAGQRLVHPFERDQSQSLLMGRPSPSPLVPSYSHMIQLAQIWSSCQLYSSFSWHELLQPTQMPCLAHLGFLCASTRLCFPSFPS